MLESTPDRKKYTTAGCVVVTNMSSDYIIVSSVEASDRNLHLEIRGIIGTTVTKRRTFDALTRHLERQISLTHRVKKRRILETVSWACLCNKFKILVKLQKHQRKFGIFV